ncbi:MAG: hypothetical protein JXB40_05525 [Candidatus Omnitrophica bacterium]|nr:hypothetical protein [Candidatus Omnitrophota bacterium]
MGFLYFPYSGLVNAIAAFAIGFFVLSKNTRSPINKAFALFTISITIWAFNYFIWLMSTDYSTALFYIRVTMIGAILIPVAFLHFVLQFINKKRNLASFTTTAMAAIFIIFSFSPDYIQKVESRLFFPFWPVPGWIFHFMLAYFVIVLLYAHALLWKAWKQEDGAKKDRAKFILFGIMTGFIGGCTNYFLWYNISIPPYLNILVSGFVVFVAYAIIRHQLLDIEVIIKKTLIFASLFIIVFGVFVGITLLTQEILAGGRLLGLAISSLIIIFTVRPLESVLIRVTDKYLFQKKYDYKHLIKEFMDELKVMVLNANDIAQSTIDFINTSVRPISSAIFMHNKFTGQYDLIASSEFKDRNFRMPDSSNLIRVLAGKVKALKIDNGEIPQQERTRFTKEGIEMIIPLLVHKELIGFLCLGNKKSDEDYTEDDVDALSGLSGALAISLNNAQLFDERADAEKRALIGTIAAGINHEIGNPLNIITIKLGTLQMLAKEGLLANKSKEQIIYDVSEISKVCLDSAERIAEITKQISEFAKPDKKLILDKVSVNEVVDETIAFLKSGMILNTEKIEKRIMCEPLYAMVDRGQLKQILFNLIKNASHAIDKEKGRIVVSIDHNGSDEIAIKIIDNGRGMPKEIMDKAFSLFFTTKEPGEGTGLGLALVKIMTERNGGRINVESQVGKGTVFTLVFKGGNIKEADNG